MADIRKITPEEVAREMALRAQKQAPTEQKPSVIRKLEPRPQPAIFDQVSAHERARLKVARQVELDARKKDLLGGKSLRLAREWGDLFVHDDLSEYTLKSREDALRIINDVEALTKLIKSFDELFDSGEVSSPEDFLKNIVLKKKENPANNRQ